MWRWIVIFHQEVKDNLTDKVTFGSSLKAGRRKLCCCCSVCQSCPTLCDPMDCNTPGFPVLHCLPELAQTHVHRVNDAIQPSHPLSSPFPAGIFPSIRVFSYESVLRIRWPKYWSFSISISPSNEYSGLISFRIYWFDLLTVQGTLNSLFQHMGIRKKCSRQRE